MVFIFLFIISILLFLYSINSIVKGLECVSDNYILNCINNFSKHKFSAVLFGVLITAFLQSSSLVTVILISLIQTKKIKLINCIWILMGANIGTTFTTQLIILDMKILIPFCLGFGMFLLYFTNDSRSHIGRVLICIAVLIISMDIMKYSTTPLGTYYPFLKLLESLSNPLVSLFVGIIMTAILQSSTASIAILQSIMLSVYLPLQCVWWVIYGQNIGTCFTGWIASYNLNKDAKKVVVVSFLINIFGMMLFVMCSIFFDITNLIISLSQGNILKIIANMQSFYNIISILLLLPFDIFLTNLTNAILKE